MQQHDFNLPVEFRKRINVVGTSGSGKSFLARQLAEKLGSPYIELDRLHLLPDWQEETDEEFRSKLVKAINVPTWVLDGNYHSKSVAIKWENPVTVIWLDLSFARTFCRAIKRAFQRAYSQQEIWPGTGNRESFRRTLFSSDSILLWTIITFRSNRKRYTSLMQDNRYSHIRFVRLRNPSQCREFLSHFE